MPGRQGDPATPAAEIAQQAGAPATRSTLRHLSCWSASTTGGRVQRFQRVHAIPPMLTRRLWDRLLGACRRAPGSVRRSGAAARGRRRPQLHAGSTRLGRSGSSAARRFADPRVVAMLARCWRLPVRHSQCDRASPPTAGRKHAVASTRRARQDAARQRHRAVRLDRHTRCGRCLPSSIRRSTPNDGVSRRWLRDILRKLAWG